MLTSTQVLPLFGGGAWFAASSPLVSDVVAPAEGDILARVPWATEHDVDAAIRRLADHDPHSIPTLDARLARVDALHAALTARREEWSDLVAREAGLTRAAADAEVDDALRGVARAGEEARTLERPRAAPHAPGTRARCVPIGTVAALLPASHPASEPASHIARALAIGAPLIVKPSIHAAFSAQWLVDVAHGVGLPPGALALVHGDRDTADALVDHPEVAAVSIAGPRDIASPVAARALARGLRVHQRAPRRVVVWVGPDANLDRIARHLTDALLGPPAGRGLLPIHVLAHPTVEDALAERLDAAAAMRDDPFTVRSNAAYAILDALAAAYPRRDVRGRTMGDPSTGWRRIPLSLHDETCSGPSLGVTTAGLPVVFTSPTRTREDALAALRHWPVVDEVALAGHADGTQAAVAGLASIPLVTVDVPLDGAALAPARATDTTPFCEVAPEMRLMTRSLYVGSRPGGTPPPS